MNQTTLQQHDEESAVVAQEFLSEAIESHDAQRLQTAIETVHPEDLPFVVSHLSGEQRTELLTSLTPDQAAEIVECLPLVQAAQVIEEISPAAAASLLDRLSSDYQADLLGELDAGDAEDILAQMSPEDAASVRDLAQYDEDVAGGLMATELLKFSQDWTVAQVIDDLTRNAETYADINIQYFYVVDGAQRLTGVLPIRSLLLAGRDRQLSQLMIREPLTLEATTELDRIHAIFEAHSFLGLPVVDGDGRLLGVVGRREVDDAWLARTEGQFLARQGILEEEIRSQPLWDRSRKRLSWLSINIVLNLVAASIISYYEPTLAQVISLAVFLPIISDMSGCSGNQAVAVSIRELMLDLARPSDVWRVWGKEAQVGLVNGTALGLMLGGIAWFWKGEAVLGLVVGVSLFLNTLIAVCIGGMVPLLLRAFGRDPAVAAGPLLTTVTDMCGFFLVLSLASKLLV